MTAFFAWRGNDFLIDIYSSCCKINLMMVKKIKNGGIAAFARI
jgi:hypothetical protein